MHYAFEKRYLPEFVYGGIDGAITTFAVVAGSIGASLSAGIILILGFANLFADGFSMAISNYLSVKAESEIHPQRKSPEEKKITKHPLKTGSATFVSFILIGLIPLISFLLSFIIPSLKINAFVLSCLLTGLALIIVGAVKSHITGKHFIRSSLETFLIGSIAALVSFAIGYLLRGLAN
ncbi:MAG TPA: VIT1/CCC1 transporter family protein [Candidatus Nanoarchaeia archaeon]|nr:VIT1/CCC1 transporter family protein [Candidatus Nanoarchaeia archaeon]